MASSEIIGGPFSNDVRTQLTRRQSVQKDNNRSSQELQHLNSRTAWVKMVSSVEDSSEKNLAKKNILAGGLQGYSGVSGYTLGEKGYRPSPGITGMQVTSVGRFGLIREATVNFNCWDIEQLEDLEKLFMRPGFSVLLEWGNTYYIDKDGNFSTVIPSVADLMITPPGSSAGQTRRDAIQKVIREKRAQSGYNYDAILGVIKNFSWKFRSDGGYDCTTVIVSSGEIVQSLTVDVDVDTVGKTGEVDPVKKAETPTMLNAIIREIEEGTAESIWTSVESLYPDFALKYKTLSPTGGTIISAKYQLQDGTTFGYIRMDSLLNILNTVIVCDKDKNPLFRFFTDITSNKVKTSFRTYSYHTSSDPGTCLISGASVDNWKCGQTFEFLDTLRTLNQGIEDSNILGIWVNTNLIKDAIKTLLGDSTKQNRSIVNFIKPILGKISEALGSCNSLDLHYEEEESTYYIIDRNFKEKVTYPEISVTGLKSTTTDFDFTSKLTPNLTGMLAISAQADLPESGVDIENFFEWNRGLTDRILGSKLIKTTSTSTEDSTNRGADQQKRYDIVYSNLGNFFVNKVYNLKSAESAKNSYTDFTRDFNYLYNEYVTDAGPKGIIPFEGTITIDGISGIKIGQIFKINTKVMPEKYDDIVGFSVTGVDHIIQNNRWYTKLKAQTTIVKYGKKKSNFAGTFKCVVLPTLIMTTLGTVNISSTSLLNTFINPPTAILTTSPNDNIIIGDSQSEYLAKNSPNVVLGRNLWDVGIGVSKLISKIEVQPKQPSVKSVIITIGVNDGYATSLSNINTLFSLLKQKFPNAKLYAVKGSRGWGKVSKITEKQIDAYYSQFTARGATVLTTSIGEGNPHSDKPVYKKIMQEFEKYLQISKTPPSIPSSKNTNTPVYLQPGFSATGNVVSQLADIQTARVFNNINQQLRNDNN